MAGAKSRSPNLRVLTPVQVLGYLLVRVQGEYLRGSLEPSCVSALAAVCLVD